MMQMALSNAVHPEYGVVTILWFSSTWWIP